MKITKQVLKRIIKEEIDKMEEARPSFDERGYDNDLEAGHGDPQGEQPLEFEIWLTGEGAEQLPRQAQPEPRTSFARGEAGVEEYIRANFMRYEKYLQTF